MRVRLAKAGTTAATVFADFDEIFARRMREADEFYAGLQADLADADARLVQRQAFAGMIWSKQFYHYDIQKWLRRRSDPAAAALRSASTAATRLAAPQQRRSDFHAGQMGVSLVRRLGSGIPLPSAGGHRRRNSPRISSSC